ncbi:hypothetical protein SDC9_168882 [bioreactor metagenome]|uniref:Uncharacterized protein n=1 Tax=bioreactor metagenome TaxID=1076179 RepID=A0A645G692_9ZZZZ
MVNHALVVLVFGTHHHTAENTRKYGNNGQCYISGNQPQKSCHRTAEQGADDALQHFTLAKAIEQLVFGFDTGRDI